jgi:hypothetical protein
MPGMNRSPYFQLLAIEADAVYLLKAIELD